MSEESKSLGYMSASSRQFIVRITILTVIIATIATALFLTILKQWYLASYPYLIVLVATVTTIGHLWVTNAAAGNARKFATAFLASVTFKLMIYLTFILVYLLIDRSQAVSFILTFVTIYVLFTIFEVVQVLNFIKKQSTTRL